MHFKATSVALAAMLVFALIVAGTPAFAVDKTGLTPYIGQCVSVFVDADIAFAGKLLVVNDVFIQMEVQNQSPSVLLTVTVYLNRIAAVTPFCL